MLLPTQKFHFRSNAKMILVVVFVMWMHACMADVRVRPQGDDLEITAISSGTSLLLLAELSRFRSEIAALKSDLATTKSTVSTQQSIIDMLTGRISSSPRARMVNLTGTDLFNATCIYSFYIPTQARWFTAEINSVSAISNRESGMTPTAIQSSSKSMATGYYSGPVQNILEVCPP